MIGLTLMMVRLSVRYSRVVQFHPKALLVTAVFVMLLLIAVEGRSGLLALAVLTGIALEALLGWGLWHAIPDKWFAWFRRRV